MTKRIAVTGLGAVTPIGVGVEAFWQSLVAGNSGIGRMETFTSGENLPLCAAQVKNFVPENMGLPRRKLKMMGRSAQLMLAAVVEAGADAGLDTEASETPAKRCGIVVGVGMLNADVEELSRVFAAARRESPTSDDGVDVESFSRNAVTEMFPLWLLRHIPNLVAAHTSILLQTRAVSNTIMNGCASGAFAIGEAARIIRRGDADIMLAGGVDARINSLAMLRYLELGWQTRQTGDPWSSSRPFDRDAAGFVSGEAAGVIVLEDLDHARRRGVKIYAELGGVGTGNDGFDVLRPHPQGRGLKRAISACLRSVGAQNCSPDIFFAAANGIPEYDRANSTAMQNAFQQFNLKPKVTATRSLIGHTHAASSALDAIASVKSVAENMAPPTLNLKNPIASFDFVGDRSQEMPVSASLIAGYGFGGHAGAVLLKRCEI